jgi:hypothetical protein
MAEQTEILTVCLNKAIRLRLEAASAGYCLKPSQVARMLIKDGLDRMGVPVPGQQQVAG